MGALGLLSGAAAMLLRKGSQRHRIAGTIFGIAMVSMTTSAVYMALGIHKIGDVLIALLTLYLVATAWKTARRRDGSAGAFEIGALMVALALAAAFMMFGVEAVNSLEGTKFGHPARRYFFFGLVALFSGAGDLRMLLRGRLIGRQRIARHLWRMNLPFFIAANTVFQGQARVFPVELRRTHALLVPLVLIAGATTFWIVRVLFFHGSRGKPAMSYWLQT